MKFQIRRRAKDGDWHRWFAWRPVRLEDWATWAWLETVERSWGRNGCYSHFRGEFETWEYRRAEPAGGAR